MSESINQELDRIADQTNPEQSLEGATELAAPLVAEGKVGPYEAATRITNRWGLPELQDRLGKRITRRAKDIEPQVKGESESPSRKQRVAKDNLSYGLRHADDDVLHEMLARPEIRERVEHSLADVKAADTAAREFVAPFTGFVDQADADSAAEVLKGLAEKIRDAEPIKANLDTLDEAVVDYQLARNEVSVEVSQ